MLYQVLETAGLTLSQQLRFSMHMNFAAQLQSLGLWKWALYVIQHLPYKKTKEFESENLHEFQMRQVRVDALKEIVYKNITSSEVLTKDEKFLIDELEIPKLWVYEAKAIKARYQMDKELEVKNLINCEQYSIAHELVVKYIAPSFILKEKYEELEKILKILKPINLPNWKENGDVYLNYVELKKSYDDVKKYFFKSDEDANIFNSSGERNLKDLSEQFSKLCENLKGWIPRNMESEYKNNEIICITEMSTTVSSCLTTLKTILSESKVSNQPIQLPLELLLTEQHRVQHLQSLTFNFLSSLS